MLNFIFLVPLLGMELNEDGEYRKIVVKFDEDLDMEQCPEILRNLEVLKRLVRCLLLMSDLL